MPQGKFHPYENDIRVPFWMRGPGITASSARSDILGTHIDIMPTLLGLVDYDSKKNNKNYVVPSTMDGENLAPQLLSKPPIHNDLLPRRRNAVLIEYIGLGDVWRYEHLEDSYNNSFRALRVMDGNHTNWKYIEFTDCQQDWNFTKQPQEYELFNLDTDPFEMHNLYSQVPHEWIVQLSKVTRHLYRCRGDTCRNSKNAFVSLFPTAIKQQPKSDIIYNDRTNRSTIG